MMAVFSELLVLKLLIPPAKATFILASSGQQITQCTTCPQIRGFITLLKNYKWSVFQLVPSNI